MTTTAAAAILSPAPAPVCPAPAVEGVQLVAGIDQALALAELKARAQGDTPGATQLGKARTSLAELAARLPTPTGRAEPAATRIPQEV